MLKLLAVLMLLAIIYCILVIGHSATRVPLTPTHKKQIDRTQTIHTVLLVFAGLAFGFTMENLLP